MIPPTLLRRLGRLAARAHRFHRFAHHPLCAPYAAERIRVGRRAQICAGCTWTLTGALGGAALAALWPQRGLDAALALALQAAAAMWFFAAVPLHARRYKWLLRGAPTMLLACGAGMGARACWQGAPAAWAVCTEVLLVALFSAAARVYRRRPPWRIPCAGCPQRDAEVCDGWQRIVQRERALHRLSGRIIARATAHR